jgi:uncharacterized protein (DUF1330 family)
VSKATIVVEGVFRSGYEEYFDEYSNKVRAYLAKSNAEVIRRQQITKRLYGAGMADLIMIIDFPSADIAETIFFAPEYLALIPLRDKVFSDFKMYIADFGNV